MRNTIKGNLLLSCIMLLSFPLLSNTIYINFDGAVIDRYEYKVDDGSDDKVIAYHLKLKDWEHMVLNVDTDKIMRYTTKPANVKSLRDIKDAEQMVKNINSGRTKIYILKRDSYGYFVHETSSAAYLFTTKYEIGYNDPDFSFAFNLAEPVSGNDLSLTDSNAAVFFEGNVTFKCPKKYLFSIENEDKLIEYTFVPKVGVVSIDPEPNPPFVQEPSLKLVKINNKRIKDFYKSHCASKGDIVNTDTKRNTNTKPTTKPTTKKKNTGKTQPSNRTNTSKNDIEILESKRYTSTSGCDIYKDLNRGLYIDRSTGHPASGECGGNHYNGGFMLNKANPNADAVVYKSDLNSQPEPTFTIYKNIDTGLYMDRSTGLPADGYFGGNTYSNGIWLNDPNKDLLANKGTTTTTNTSTTATTSSSYPTTVHDQLTCGIYKDLDKNLYFDRNTGLPANNSCGGNTFRNGYLVGQSVSSRPSTEVVSSKGGTSVSPCGLIASSGEHVVQSKETLYSIARRYNVSVKQLRAWNGMTSRQTKINVCGILKIAPAFVSKGRPSPCGKISSYGVHVVQPKETLFGIAKSNRLTVKQLKAYNNITTNTIHPCMELYTKAPAAANKVVPQEYSYTSKGRVNPYAIPADGMHTVKGNETLYSIAKRYGVSIDQIKRLNALNSDKINMGQRLILVYTTSSATTSVITRAKGSSTTQEMPKGMPKSVPVEYGNTSTSSLKRQIAAPFTNKGTRTSTTGNIIYHNSRRLYKVKTDDTLYSISNRYGVSVSSLRALNELDNKEIIIPGQQLYLD